MTDLAGKTALVTGASRGIGRAAAIAHSAARVIVHYGQGVDEANAVVAEIRAADSGHFRPLHSSRPVINAEQRQSVND